MSSHTLDFPLLADNTNHIKILKIIPLTLTVQPVKVGSSPLPSKFKWHIQKNPQEFSEHREKNHQEIWPVHWHFANNMQQ